MLPQRSHIGEATQPRLSRSWGHHLTRERGVYYYRRRLPGRSRHELTLSLRTRNYREAEYLAERADSVFAKAVARMSSPETIQQIVSEHIRELVETDMVYYHNRPGSEPIYDISYKSYPDRRHLSALEADESFLAELLSEAKQNLVERRLEAEAEDTAELMTKHGLAETQRNALAHSLLSIRLGIA